MIRAETDTKKLLAALKFIDKEAMPKVVSDTLNHAASATTNEAQKNARKRLVIRREFSIKSIKQDRTAKGQDIIKMYSRSVIRAPYMIAQEFGLDSKPGSGFQNVPVPTVFSRGGDEKKIIIKRFWLDKLPKEGEETQGNSNIFIGVPKGGNRQNGVWLRHSKNKKLTMLRSLTKETIVKKAVLFFADAVKKYGTPQFIRAVFDKKARAVLKKSGLDMKNE